ncbi:MAG: hypothetical protein FWE86_03900 [Oscillospiraceae bacterium]|nr:hypothetical protein [Oscillospiraceae bacterium]
MTQKQRKTIKVCLIIVAISMAVVTASTIISIIYGGWGALSIVNIVLLISGALVLVGSSAVLASNKKKNNK